MNLYNQIKEKIIQGGFKPGERLTEEFLAKYFNTSRTPVREAIMQLQMNGLIVPLKRGIVVKEYTKEDVRQIYDLRILLEGHMAYQAAVYRTEQDITLLQQANQEYKNIYERFHNNKDIMEEIMNTNNLFHQTVANAANNNYIQTLISKVAITPLIYQSLYWYNEKRFERSINSHETITKAIIDHDGNRAKTAMLEHMYQGKETVLKLIEEKQEVFSSD